MTLSLEHNSWVTRGRQCPALQPTVTWTFVPFSQGDWKVGVRSTVETFLRRKIKKKLSQSQRLSLDWLLPAWLSVWRQECIPDPTANPSNQYGQLYSYEQMFPMHDFSHHCKASFILVRKLNFSLSFWILIFAFFSFLFLTLGSGNKNKIWY